MKTNESIVVIPNGEAYGRIYTCQEAAYAPTGSRLLAVYLTEQQTRDERMEWRDGQNVRVPAEIRTLPTFVFGIPHEIHQTELEGKLIELEATISELRNKAYTAEDKARANKTEHEKLSRELETKTNQATRWSEANATLTAQLEEIRRHSQKIERDLGKVREQIGKKAFDEALAK